MNPFLRLKNISCYPGIRMMHARYVKHKFTKHCHEGYAFGVIEHGNLGFNYRGESLCASAGDINLVNPDEPHVGHDLEEEGAVQDVLKSFAVWYIVFAKNINKIK